MSLNIIYNRVCVWNERRYDRVYDMSLTVSLLREEYTEYFEAIQPVHQLDALCDTIYVALGALWKVDLNESVMQSDMQTAAEITHALMEANVIEPIYLVGSFIDSIEHDTNMPDSLALQVIVNLCMVQMQLMRLELKECYAALLVVCDSNDSKSIKKTDPTVKANVDKGEFFVAPEPRLNKILEKANERHS